MKEDGSYGDLWFYRRFNNARLFVSMTSLRVDNRQAEIIHSREKSQFKMELNTRPLE